jgi:hypothetical protein
LYSSPDETKRDVIGGICSKLEGDERYTQKFNLESRKEETAWGNLI